MGRPIINQHGRAYALAHLDQVDYVVIFHEKTVLKTIQKLKPDIFFTVDEDWNSNYKQSPEYLEVRSYGGKVVREKRQAPLLSSAAIISKAAQKKVYEIFKECMDSERFDNIRKEQSKLK